MFSSGVFFCEIMPSTSGSGKRAAEPSRARAASARARAAVSAGALATAAASPVGADVVGGGGGVSSAESTRGNASAKTSAAQKKGGFDMVDRLACSPLLRPEGLTLAVSEEGVLKNSTPVTTRGTGASTGYLPQ